MTQQLKKISTQIRPFFNSIKIFTGYLDLVGIQKNTSKEFKGKSGIYPFLCKTTKKLYVGTLIDLSSRFYGHINGSWSNIKFQNAINKYKL